MTIGNREDKATKVKVREQVIINQVLQFLAIKGCYAWRNNTGAMKIGHRFVRFGHKGIADIIGIIPKTGQFLAIECKTKTGKTTQFQEDFLKAIRDRGGLALVVRDVSEIENIF
jgi:hypothetical protein